MILEAKWTVPPTSRRQKEAQKLSVPLSWGQVGGW